MSSPPDSITDFDESALNKKRGRAQSVEPPIPQDINDDVNSSQEVSSTTVSAPKKTKRDDEDNSTTVSTIRRNMKDMSTTDDVHLVQSQSTGTSDSQDDETMGAIAEEEDSSTNNNNNTNNLLAKFGGANKEDDDDWGEFAEEEEEEKASTTKADEDKPKYTFGASSGFGTKGWAASHQTMPTPSKQPTFGGFGSCGFGGFKSASQPTVNDNTTTEKSTSVSTSSSTISTAPTFGSFAKATASPFAAAAAAGNALSSTDTKPASPVLSTNTSVVEKVINSDENESENNDTPTTFGEGAKVKVPGVKQTEVKTGEEGEDTIFQTKAKLLVLDTTSGNWKERGVGTFRINMKEEEIKKVLQTRLVMRTDSVYRVILNLLLFEGMKVFIMQDKFVRFAGFETETKEDGTVETKLISFALKLSNPSIAEEVCNRITEHIPTHSS